MIGRGALCGPDLVLVFVYDGDGVYGAGAGGVEHGLVVRGFRIQDDAEVVLVERKHFGGDADALGIPGVSRPPRPL